MFKHMHREYWGSSYTEQGINYSLSCIFLGIKAWHTFVCLCAGACTKNVPVNEYLSLIHQEKTNADLHSPKEHFRHLHQKYPERHKDKIEVAALFFFAHYLCSQMKYPWNEIRDKKKENRCLTTQGFCWGWICMEKGGFNETHFFLSGTRECKCKAAKFWRKDRLSLILLIDDTHGNIQVAVCACVCVIRRHYVEKSAHFLCIVPSQFKVCKAETTMPQITTSF